MGRFLFFLIIGVIVGTMLGLLIGWELYPAEYVDSPLSLLDQDYKEQYTVMIAYGYVFDGDLESAVARLRALNVTNIAGYVQEITERYITQSRNLEDIRHLVALAEGMGRLTPMMESYRLLPEESNS